MKNLLHKEDKDRAVLASDTIQGTKVINKKGDELGKIEELMIDWEKGRISYAVLSFGGILGIGDKLFAIPWDVMEYDPVVDRFLLNIDKKRLENAPGFDKDHWPDNANPKWEEDIYSYYGSRPYWI